MKITTKKYIDNQIKWLQKVNAAEVTSIRRAVDKVESNYIQDKAQANEWRGTLKDTQMTYITKREVVAWILAAISLAGLVISYFK